MQNFAKFRLKFVFFDENHKNDHFSIASNRHLNFINGLVDQYIVLSDENWPDFIMFIMMIIHDSNDLGQCSIRYSKMYFKRLLKVLEKKVRLLSYSILMIDWFIMFDKRCVKPANMSMIRFYYICKRLKSLKTQDFKFSQRHTFYSLIMTNNFIK